MNRFVPSFKPQTSSGMVGMLTPVLFHGHESYIQLFQQFDQFSFVAPPLTLQSQASCSIPYTYLHRSAQWYFLGLSGPSFLPAIALVQGTSQPFSLIFNDAHCLPYYEQRPCKRGGGRSEKYNVLNNLPRGALQYLKKTGGLSVFRWQQQQLTVFAFPIVFELLFPIGLSQIIWEWQNQIFFFKITKKIKIS